MLIIPQIGGGRVLNEASPLNPNWPANRGLIGNWCAIAGSSYYGGMTFRNLVPNIYGAAFGNGAVGMGSTGFTANAFAGNIGRKGGRGAVYTPATAVLTTALTSTNMGKVFTISGWFNTASRATAFRNICAFSSSYVLILDMSNVDASGDSMGFWTSDGLAGAAMGTPALSSANGSWYHFAFVRKGDSIAGGYEVYFNGALTGTANTVVYTPSVDVFTIAGRPLGVDQLFNGFVDDICIYNRALPANEIKLLYQESLQGNPNRYSWLSSRYGIDAVAPAGANPSIAGFASRTHTIGMGFNNSF